MQVKYGDLPPAQESDQIVYAIQGGWDFEETEFLGVFGYRPSEEDVRVLVNATPYDFQWVFVIPTVAIPKCRCLSNRAVLGVCPIHRKGDRYVRAEV